MTLLVLSLQIMWKLLRMISRDEATRWGGTYLRFHIEPHIFKLQIIVYCRKRSLSRCNLHFIFTKSRKPPKRFVKHSNRRAHMLIIAFCIFMKSHRALKWVVKHCNRREKSVGLNKGQIVFQVLDDLVISMCTWSRDMCAPFPCKTHSSVGYSSRSSHFWGFTKRCFFD